MSASGKRVHNGKSPQRNKKIQSPPKKRRKTDTEENAIKVILGAYEIYHKYRVIVKEGGIKLILNTMKRHREDGRVQKNGCAALLYIARENADNQKTIAKEGGIKVILDAMDKYQENGDVQENGCGTLVNLACDDDDNKKTIAKEGGINVILDAMKRHKKNEYVQTYGRDALSNLLGV